MNKKLLRKKQKLRQKLARSSAGFHVYRSENEDLPFSKWRRMTNTPIPKGSFDDPSAEIGKRYFYKLTQVYSDGTESAPIKPKSRFTDHAGNSYSQNPLRDFVGYNIYRSPDADLPLDQWEKRNDAPLPTTEFKDEGVNSGEEFFYYIRAVDSRGVESAPGEVIKVIRK